MKKTIISLLYILAHTLTTSAQYYIECEDTCRHMHGIDISHHQKEIFWEAIGENSKMAFVYMKATEGGDFIDPAFERNIRLAKRYGLKVGVYHFFRAQTNLETQARNFRAQCRPEDQDLLPMIDIETKPSGMSTTAFVDSVQKFLEIVTRIYKQKPLVYTYTNFYNNYLLGKVNDYKLWIAQYSTNEPRLRDERDYIMWQYTAKGRINGVQGYVDKNRFMGRHSMREIRFRKDATPHGHSRVEVYPVEK
ncbi:MAG: glycosyl hydrolase family 25 [Prevotella sp.]|nr:glycosyl hydrolase family 25 [Prevotella sp.]